MEENKFKYGDEEIAYLLIRKQVKNINLNVKADGRIFVSAEHSIPKETIEKFLIRKSRWIYKHLNKFEHTKEIFTPPKEYISGENYNYLGKQYRLKIIKAGEDKIEIDAGYIKLYTKDKDNFERKKSLVNSWYKTQIQTILQHGFEMATKKHSTLLGNNFVLKIRVMKTRWGTFNAKNNLITLNSNLIFAPEYCIEYVVLHELIHSKHLNHCKRFFELLENLMPDWRERKKILDEEVVKFIA